MSPCVLFFVTPLLLPAQAQAKLNQFLLQHHEVNRKKRWGADEPTPNWSRRIPVIADVGPLLTTLRAQGQSPIRANGKEHYREVLSEPDLAACLGLLR